MKYLKRFNEELYIEDEKNDIIYDIDDIDSVINNIESIMPLNHIYHQQKILDH